MRLEFYSFFSFKDNLVLRDLTKQITHLTIDMKKPTISCSETTSNVLSSIISSCKKLTVLNFCHMILLRECPTPIFLVEPERNISSTFLKLKINVGSFVDCLCVLDGRFECLSTLSIKVWQILGPVVDIGGRVRIILVIVLER